MSEMLKKQEHMRQKKQHRPIKIPDRCFISRHLPDGSMIRTVFPFTMEKSICFTSITHMQGSGDRCTGGTV